jgi:hypothetical protein
MNSRQVVCHGALVGSDENPLLSRRPDEDLGIAYAERQLGEVAYPDGINEGPAA